MEKKKGFIPARDPVPLQELVVEAAKRQELEITLESHIVGGFAF